MTPKRSAAAADRPPSSSGAPPTTVTGGTGRLGRIGEVIAARHLEAQGMEVLERNWRCRLEGLRGEVDLVLRDGRTVVFCEVKTRRRPGPAGPLEGITPLKLARLRRLAGAWLAVRGGPRQTATDIRIDAVGVHWPVSGGPPVVTHLPGVDA